MYSIVRWSAMLLVFAAMTTPATSWGQRTGDGDRTERSAMSDAWITAKTKARLMKDPGLSPFSINVDTHHGVVTLFGKVESEAVRKQAEAEARMVAGACAVALADRARPRLVHVPDLRERRDDLGFRRILNCAERYQVLIVHRSPRRVSYF